MNGTVLVYSLIANCADVPLRNYSLTHSVSRLYPVAQLQQLFTLAVN